MKSYQDVLGNNKPTALIPFFVLGDPDVDTSLAVIKAAVDAGADVLELGIPFSDPIADGPTIQKADIRALENGMTVHKALDVIRTIRAYTDVPIGLLMYYNLVYHYGREAFYRDFAAAGINSVLIADTSIDDADEVVPAARAAGLDTVFMVTPNTAPQRRQRIAAQTTGFIYTVSVMGVTGSRTELSDAVKPLVADLKSITDKPVCVGFGISSPEHAATVAQAGAQGVIIGSKIVSLMENNLGDSTSMIEAVQTFIRAVKAAL